jgi:hypothetical protein
MTNIKYQNYLHYKLPITMDPLKYGKLMLNIEKLFIVQVNKTNVVIINQHKELNSIKLFKEGDLIFEFKDIKINESTFVRHLENKKFTFKNNALIEFSTKTLMNRLNLLFNQLIIRVLTPLNLNSTTLLKINKTKNEF